MLEMIYEKINEVIYFIHSFAMNRWLRYHDSPAGHSFYRKLLPIWYISTPIWTFTIPITKWQLYPLSSQAKSSSARSDLVREEYQN